MTAVLVVCAVLAVAAIVALASAWKTLDWLADAEDLLEHVRDDATAGRLRTGILETSTLLELTGYRRRSPQRRV